MGEVKLQAVIANAVRHKLALAGGYGSPWK